MCLDSVGKTATLKKDINLWKTVYIESDGEVSMRKTGKTRRYNFSKKRLHESKRKRAVMCEDSTDKYIPHFHGFTSKRAANKIQREYHTLTVREFIIPKGTTVLYGKQSISKGWTPCFIVEDAEVVVTPVLINPRVPE